MSRPPHTPAKGPADAPRLAGPLRVLCVDDNQGMILALELMLGADPALCCLGTLRSADRLRKLVEDMNPRPDVLIVDARMPGADPFAAVAELAQAVPAARSIFYTGYHDGPALERARAAGAWGCVSKQEEPDAIVHAIHEVAEGRPVWPADPAKG